MDASRIEFIQSDKHIYNIYDCWFHDYDFLHSIQGVLVEKLQKQKAVAQ